MGFDFKCTERIFRGASVQLLLPNWAVYEEGWHSVKNLIKKGKSIARHSHGVHRGKTRCCSALCVLLNGQQLKFKRNNVSFISFIRDFS